MNQHKVFYDDNQVRYTFIQGSGEINWLFLPGGPGTDSSYYLELLDILSLPGNVWLLDLPGNGTNHVANYDFDKWLEIFVPTIQSFKNPVLVGNSFGGMFPLLFPELENILKGFVIFNSSPVLWVEAAKKYAAKHNLPDFSKEITECLANPCQETFDAALQPCMPYYFPKNSLAKGKELFAKTKVAFEPCLWWFKKAIEMQYNAKWIPQNVKTLIVGAEFDGMTPFELFTDDKRFARPNIELFFIKGAGHLPWVEKPIEVKNALQQFREKLVK